MKTVKGLVLVPLLVMAIVLLSVLAVAQGNLIPNGDCEIDANGDGLADGWHFSGDEGVSVTLQLDKGYQSRHSQRVSCTDFKRISPSSHVLLWVAVPALTEDKWYELSFAVKGEKIGAGAVSVSILETEPLWKPVGLIEAFGPRRQWRTYRLLFRATKSVSEGLRLQFWFTSTGTLWLDKVALVEREPFSQRFTEAVPSAGGKNLVPNSSFELGKVAWGSFAQRPGWGGNLNRLIGEIDTTTAAVHRCSLRIELRPDNIPVHFADYFPSGNLMFRQPELAPLAANRGWISVKPGQPYTLSAYLKSDKPGLIAILGVREPEEEHRTAVTVDADWKRYSFTCAPTGSQVFVCLGPDLAASSREMGILWIDGVQFEAGKRATDYEPRAVVEVGLRKVGREPIFALGKPAQVEIVAFNAGEKESEVIARCEVRDFREHLKEIKKTLRAGAGKAVSARIDLESSRRGFCRIALEARGAAVVTNRPLRTAIVEPYRSEDSLFGMNHAYPWPELLDICKEIGVRWFRDWSLKWEAVEAQPGQFDFTESDYQINRLLKRGLFVLGLLPFPSSNWSSSAPEEVSATSGDGSARMVYMPRNLDEYANYVRKTVEHYRGRISVWEVMNEPFYTAGGVLGQDLGYTLADYVKMLQVAYKTIKAVDPQLTVLGGIAGGPDLYTREFIEAGGLAYVDALTIHSYPCMTPPEAFLASYEELVKRMGADGRRRPIAFTEGAYYADDDNPFEPFSPGYPRPVASEWEAAVLQARLNIILLAYGTHKIIYHCGSVGSINNESLYSLFFEYDAEPRKMLVSQAALARLFGADTRPLGRLQTPPDVYIWAFSSRGNSIVAAWAIDERFSLGPLPARAQLLDIIGNEMGARQVELTEEPVFVVMPGEVSAEELQRLIFSR